MKYSDLIAQWLKEAGYTHCFFVAGGNIMHLLESFRHKFECVPFVHEVAAGIGAEYFTATATGGKKALALVTAGPGLTNIITAIAGAYLESRDLLVIGGQVKTADLSHGKVRQRGIQEICGIDIARPISVLSYQMLSPLSESDFKVVCAQSHQGRPGPVFLEIPLDVQAMKIENPTSLLASSLIFSPPRIPDVRYEDVELVAEMILGSKRPAVLIGAGVSHKMSEVLSQKAASSRLPLFTTWNGADRIAANHSCYFGRPNTWGQRYSNLLLQQADLILALGTRLGLQQTGFNWKEFGFQAKIIQIDLDPAELEKGHPHIDFGICADVNDFLDMLLDRLKGDWNDWHGYCQRVKKSLPLVEKNETGLNFVSPFHFVEILSELANEGDIVVPCSSGGAFTVMMQIFAQKTHQKIITDKGLAAMGYGLSGAIGAALANPSQRTILVEGDGGFAQNLQEIGTAAINRLNLKIFIFDDSGYASIRMTQKNYFGGQYIGCDVETGLGLPNWEILFKAYGVPSMRLAPDFEKDPLFKKQFEEHSVAAFIVSLDPAQTYFPKIMSRVTPTGMESNPLHRMSPDLPEDLLKQVGKYLEGTSPR